MISIDGAYGEGGGQVLRTSLTLAILTGQPVKIERIRAGRPKPGLAAQHLTAVRAAAAICDASLDGDEMGSGQLSFAPAGPARPGEYRFDVGEMRQGGSAGSVSLVLQTLLLPLALAPAPSQVTLRGGTHVAWSPPFPYLEEVYLWTLARCGLRVELALNQWGFYPAGGGEIVARIGGGASALRPVSLAERGAPRRVWGTAAVSNLPSHIPQRMADRARNLLAGAGLKANVQARRVRANGPGAGIFVLAEYEGDVRAGFTAYGRKGLPSEQVAEMACEDLLDFHNSGGAVDMYLADQLILPLAIAGGPSTFVTHQVTRHLRTNMWVVEQFGLARFTVAGRTVEVIPQGRVEPLGYQAFSGVSETPVPQGDLQRGANRGQAK
jgi:RNA 3'-terminal phosphate cyclase (ATP)